MRKHELNQLPQVHIAEPCSANWDDMTGDDSRRFCTKCNLHVQNISETPSDIAEQILTQGKTCIRAVGDGERGIRTKDGWLPKLLVAGAVAATINGCAIMGSDGSYGVEEPGVTQPNTPVTGAAVARPPVMGEMTIQRPTETIGKVKVQSKGERIGRVLAPKPTKATKSPKA